MAGKPQNRLELRRQYDAAEPLDPMEDEAEDLVDDGDDDDSEKKPKKKAKAKAPAKSKAKAAKPAKVAARMRVVWKVVNDAFKEVGTFDFTQREAAEARAAELTAKGKGTHFVQRSKEPMPDNAPGLGAAIPRPVPVVEVKPVEAAVVAEVDEEIEDEDEDVEPDEEAEDEEE